MNRSKLINAGGAALIIVITGLTIWFENVIDLVPKYLSHPILSAIAIIYVVMLMLIGFFKLLDKIVDVFQIMKLKG